jgi:hydrogenase expression/formation protein HypD
MKALVVQLTKEIAKLSERCGRPVRYMEVCGTHTVSLYRSGVRSLLPPSIQLVSGPGCPVCVTAQRHIDAAIELATREDTVIATYGDMLRVPGRLGSLDQLRARGARIRVVTSAMSALEMAIRDPQSDVVLLAVGFETTAPATAVVVREAAQRRVKNFSVLAYHKLVVPAMLALMADGRSALDGFLCPGHVSVIIGSDAFCPIVQRHRFPCVVAGFEPVQLLLGIRALVQQTVDGRAAVENVYPAAVSRGGNPSARALIEEVFQTDDVAWRAMGVIPLSGLRLAGNYELFDAQTRYSLTIGDDEDHPACRCGDVIQGRADPTDCTLFRRICTPANPIGPCMVSSEGTCAAWHRYQRVEPTKPAQCVAQEVHRVTAAC